MEVVLHIYDLSGGLAAQFSQALIGQHVEAIYHTGVVAYGREWFFGGGIFADAPGQTPYGVPMRRIVLGQTNVPRSGFDDFINSIRPRFTMETYDIAEHNCNVFSNEVSMFLVGAPIPQYILDLPDRLLSTPLGQMIMPLLRQRQEQMRQFFESRGGGATAANGAALTTSLVGAGVGNATSNASSGSRAKVKFQPVLFKTGNWSMIVEKLIAQCKSKSMQLNADDFATLRKFEEMENNANCSIEDAQLTLLMRCVDELGVDGFAALDALRMLLVRADLNARLVRVHEKEMQKLLKDRIHAQFDVLPTPYRIMGLRVCVNLFGGDAGVSFARSDDIIDTLIGITLRALKTEHDSVRLSGGTALHSLAHTGSLNDERVGLVVSALVEAVDEGDVNAEWLFTAMMALYGFYETSTTAKELVLGLELDTDRLAASSKQKTKDLAAKFVE